MKKTVLAVTALAAAAFAQTGNGSPTNFVPAEYRIVKEVKGDLNKDGLEDYVLIIKGTDRKNVIDGEDTNRRGIIVVFNRGGGRYELALENRNCFSSEQDIPPHLVVRIKNGNLYIDYFLGSNFGYRSYAFRYRNSDFELIGYDVESMSGIVVYKTRSVNFLTKKMQTRIRTNSPDARDSEGLDYGEFKETWENITHKEPIKLRDIVDYDDFDDKLSDKFYINE